MRSDTKVLLDTAALHAICATAGFADVTNVHALGAGEFNAVYAFDAGGEAYALKIAPDAGQPVMRYETGIMQAEVYWYDKLRKHTDISVPDVVYTDFTRTQLPSDFFIMRRITGKQMNEMDFTPLERLHATATLPQMAAQIHRIRHARFGYRQNGYYDTWDQALYAMIEAVAMDAADQGAASKTAQKALALVKKHKTVLAGAPCRMVNFDLWEPNILCERTSAGMRYTWIDPERSFWGDPVMDFICFEPDKPLQDKQSSIKAYNRIAQQPFSITRDTRIRFAFAQAYLGVIMEVERYFRYHPDDEGWARNERACESLFAESFACLETL